MGHYPAYINKNNKSRIDQQLQSMRERKKATIEFYCTDYTDEAVQHLRGNAEVEYIAFNLADLSDQGLKELSTLPNLKGLLIYGGRITNDGLVYLKQAPKLERLILRNTGCNDDGILILKDFAHLRHLGLDDDRQGGPIFSEKALIHLSQLTQLMTIDLGGSWAPQTAVHQLRIKLPTCTITQYQYSSSGPMFEPY